MMSLMDPLVLAAGQQLSDSRYSSVCWIIHVSSSKRSRAALFT